MTNLKDLLERLLPAQRPASLQPGTAEPFCWISISKRPPALLGTSTTVLLMLH